MRQPRRVQRLPDPGRAARSIIPPASMGIIADVIEIVRERPDSVFERDAKNQFTALHYAAWIGHRRMARHLVRSGSDLYAADVHGRWPVDLAYGSGDKVLIDIIERETYPENRGGPDDDPFEPGPPNVTPLAPRGD